MTTPRQPQWRRVLPGYPCPICRHPDWCTIAPDGAAACCMRVESPRALKNGGWLHWLKDLPPRPLPPPRRQVQAEPVEDFGAMHAAWASETRMEAVCDLAEALGVSYRALYRLGTTWAPQHRAWAFPMRDGTGAAIGIRLRSMDGRKWAVRGSRAGLIFEAPLAGAGTLLVCEGPTDTAAAITAGFAAVGRPSCRGQDDLLRAVLAGWHGDTVIVADHDRPHERPNGDAWRPGLEGAVDLARAIRRPCRIIMPPGKDIREWVRGGATRGDIEAAIRDARWLNVR